MLRCCHRFSKEYGGGLCSGYFAKDDQRTFSTKSNSNGILCTHTNSNTDSFPFLQTVILLLRQQRSWLSAVAADTRPGGRFNVHVVLTSDGLQNHTELKGITAIFEANPKDSFARAMNDSDGEEAGGVDYLLNTECVLSGCQSAKFMQTHEGS